MRIKIFLLLVISMTLSQFVSSQDLIINEMMAKNQSVLMDGFGEYSDWIEIYNNSNNFIELLGYNLSDDPNDPFKWQFPESIIEPEGFLIIFASRRDTMVNTEIHTNFKLDADGETILLSDNEGNILNLVEFEKLPANHSFGRFPNASENFTLFYNSTPKYGNNNGINLNVIETSHSPGLYSNSILFEITSNIEHDTIRYTLDGSKPTIESPIYNEAIFFNSRENDSAKIAFIPTTPLEGPFPLPKIIWKPPDSEIDLINVIRYRAFSGSNPSSDVHSCTFLIDENIHTKYNFPVFSLITGNGNLFNYDTGIYIPGKRFEDFGWTYYWPDGNYRNAGEEWERFGHIEFFEVDGELVLSQDCGIRIFGGWSAAQSQKSLRLIARDKYGEDRFQYEFFQDNDLDDFKYIVLRNSGNDFLKTLFRDAFMQSLLVDLDLELQNFRPSILYINGEYWGIHNIREKYAEPYFKRYFNVDEDSLILVGVCGGQDIGDNIEYHQMIQYINENPLSIQNNYEYIKTKIDIANFVDYNLAQIFFGNNDWPSNNNRAWKTTNPESKWRWLIFDLDFGFGYNRDFSYNSLADALAENSQNYYNAPCATFLLRKLLESEEFFEYFIDRYVYLLNTVFLTDTLLSSINRFENLYAEEYINHYNRWHYPESYNEWLYEIDILREYAKYRACYCVDHVKNQFGINNFGYSCDTLIKSQIKSTQKYLAYPNPCKDYVQIKSSEGNPEYITIEIVDIAGRFIGSSRQIMHKYADNRIDVSQLANGMYFLKFIDSDSPQIIKINVQN